MKVIKLNFSNGTNSLFSQLCIDDHIILEDGSEETNWVLDRKTVRVNAKSLEVKSGELGLREGVQTKIDEMSDKYEVLSQHVHSKNELSESDFNEYDRLNTMHIRKQVFEQRGKNPSKK